MSLSTPGENLSIFIHFKLPEDTDFGDHSLKKENARVQGQLKKLLSQVDSDSGPDYRKARGDRWKGKIQEVPELQRRVWQFTGSRDERGSKQGDLW